ncbi:uncharacterized protein DUF3291 [Litoreibacter ponti]|uniref:Uncharacterized protein DUF3291 n=1 Tax=Litoreibacter ponti TaxID=1510457 RepID=A0A2T6BKI4_9RHOB|nr:DUF3291 domain-containing protein [Litoreibacter ponti]PTX56556.1 uncharacterized protein DUF3291 [Litoreibacter ponti]
MDGHHLAELNIGRLVAPVDDPRVAEFIDNIDRINGLGQRMPGFVWMLEGSGGPGATDHAIGGDDLLVPNLTVWEDAASLETFVWGTVHKKFYEKRQEWFEVLGSMHFVMWWVPIGHRPSLEEALERLALREQKGDTPDAFGWDHLKDATMWKTHGCQHVAAE